MTAATRYTLPRGTGERSVAEALAEAFRVVKERPAVRRETYLDTFDWRLYRQSLSLGFGGGALVLRNRVTGETELSAEARALPARAADLPPGALAERLKEILGARALLPIVEAQTEVKSLRILDRREKTVARVEFETVRLVTGDEAAPFARHLWLRPVRGYDGRAAEVAGCLAAAGVTRADEDVFAGLIEAGGKRPLDYSPKLDFDLDPGMSAHDAVVFIFRFLVRVMRMNEEGIRKDIDTEHLHDWRVATRRTRAGLGQLKKVFPAGVSKKYREVLAGFGDVTNRLRDLDVYVMNVDEYRRLIPAEIRRDIEPLFEHVRAERARELERVREWLDSDAYSAPLADWEKTLAEPLDPSAARANARVAVVDVAGKAIRKRYRVVVESGKEAAANPEDAKLHRVRIECKKLRYLLEFFSSLYPPGAVEEFVAQLKTLQDNLGRHQDIFIQQSGLRKFAEGFSPDAGEAATRVAVGALIGALEREKSELRSRFTVVFGRFASEENARVFRALFGGERRGSAGRRPSARGSP